MKKFIKALVLFVAVAVSSYTTFATGPATVEINNASDFKEAITQKKANSTWNINGEFTVDLQEDGLSFTKAFAIPANVTINGKGNKIELINFPKKNIAVFNVNAVSEEFKVNDLTIAAPGKDNDVTLTPTLFNFSGANATFNNVTLNADLTKSAGFALYFAGKDNNVTFTDSNINNGRLKFTDASAGNLSLTKTEIDHTNFNKFDLDDEVFYYADNAQWNTTATDSIVKTDLEKTFNLHGQEGLNAVAKSIPTSLKVNPVEINKDADLKAFIDGGAIGQTVNLNANVVLGDITEPAGFYKFPERTTINGNGHSITVAKMNNKAQKVFVAEGSLTVKNTTFVAPDKTDGATKVYYTPTLFSFEGNNSKIDFDGVKLQLSAKSKNPALALYFYGTGNDVTFNKVEMLKGRMHFADNTTGNFELNNSTVADKNPYKDGVKDEVIYFGADAAWNMKAKNSTISILADGKSSAYKTDLNKIKALVNKIKGVGVKVTHNSTSKVVVAKNTTYYYTLKGETWFNNKTVIKKGNVATTYLYKYNRNNVRGNDARPKNGSQLTSRQAVTTSKKKVTRRDTMYYNNYNLASKRRLQVLNKKNKLITTTGVDRSFHKNKKVKYAYTVNRNLTNGSYKNRQKVYYNTKAKRTKAITFNYRSSKITKRTEHRYNKAGKLKSTKKYGNAYRYVTSYKKGRATKTVRVKYNAKGKMIQKRKVKIIRSF